MRLTLVAIHAGRNPEAIALGAACIAAAIRADAALKGRVETCLLESWIESGSDPVPDLAQQIQASRPDLVGFSIYVWNSPAMRRLADNLRRELPHIRFFAGGPDASADPDRAIAEMNLDFVVVGEGERATCQVLEFLLENRPSGLETVPGIRLPCAVNPSQPGAGLAADFLASPWLDGSLVPVSGGGVLWELARGCPFACSFCYESRGGRGVRPIPADRLIAEFALFQSAGIRHIFVLDPTFNANRQRTLDWLARFAQAGMDMHFTFEVRAEFLDAAQAKAFSAINCSVQIGLQSVHPTVLSQVGRSLDRAGFAQKIGLLNQQGVVFGLDLMYGLPQDSLQGFRQSLDWSLRLQPNHLDVFALAVLPGTQLALDATSLGLLWQPDPPYLVLEQPGFSAADMGQARRLAHSVDVFYNRGRAVPWFDIILRALKAKPAQFLQEFADWLVQQESGGSFHPASTHQTIETWQCAFVQERFGAAGKPGLWPAARDLIRLHGAWSRALAEGVDSQIELDYSPEALENSAILDLAGFVARQARQAGRYRVRSGKGGIRLEKIRRSARP